MRWLAGIERDIGVGPSLGESAVCPETGTPYVEIVWDASGALWLDDHTSPVYGKTAKFDSERMAWAAWASGFDQYRRGRAGKLYWRCKPEMHPIETGTHVDAFGESESVKGGWFVYARLVIDPQART